MTFPTGVFGDRSMEDITRTAERYSLFVEDDAQGYPFLTKFVTYPCVVVDGLKSEKGRGDHYKQALCDAINALQEECGVAGIVDDVLGMDDAGDAVEFVRVEGKATLSSLRDFGMNSHKVRTYASEQRPARGGAVAST